MKDFDKFFDLVKVITTSDDKAVKAIIKTSPEQFIKFIGDISINILYEIIPLTVYYLDKLDKHSNIVRKIGSRRLRSRKIRILCTKYSQIVTVLLKASYDYLYMQ